MNTSPLSRTTLGHVASVKHGYAFPSENFNFDGKYVLLTPANFDPAGGFRLLGARQKRFTGQVPSQFRLEAGKVLVAMTEQGPGLLGAALVVPDDGEQYLHNQRLGLLEIKDSLMVDAGFLSQWFGLATVRKAITQQSVGTKVKHTSPERLEALPIALPPLCEQRKIAEILRVWDEAIEHLQRLQHSLKARRNAISSELIFGSGRPHGTRWESAAEDWAIRPIGELASETGSRNSALRADAVLTCSKHRGFVRSDEYFGRTVYSADLSNYKLVERNEFGFPSNHVEEGSIGLQNVVDTGAVSPIYTVFKFHADLVNPRFAFLVLKSPQYTHMFRASTSATVDRRGSLRWTDFSQLPFPLPPLSTQAHIAQIVDDLSEELAQSGRLETRYREQKRGLMQKLLTGEIRVTGNDIENLEPASNG